MTIAPEERAELRRLHDEAELGPWIAVTPFTGKDWLVCSLGTDCEGKDWAVTTDGLHASECRGNGPEWDAKLIVAMRNAMPRLLDALEAAERERDRLREQGGELFLSGQVAKLREERDAAVAENDRLRNLPQSAFEAATMAAANATERQLREERDALQGIVDDIASETGHCLLLDDEEHEAPTLPDWVRGIVKERDAVSAELEACKAAAAEAGVDGIPLPDAIRRLGSLNDKAEEKEADLSRQVYELKARICKMDCRYTMGEVADISGSHCNEPCDRCAARRERESLEAELEACQAKLAALVSFNEELLGRERKEVYPECDLCRDSGHGHECPGPIPNPRWTALHDAIAAAKEPTP